LPRSLFKPEKSCFRFRLQPAFSTSGPPAYVNTQTALTTTRTYRSASHLELIVLLCGGDKRAQKLVAELED
jgi:hypothetical protein